MKNRQDRLRRLMPGGIPRWVRVYDNHEFEDSIDRFTVVFTGAYGNIGRKRGVPTECNVHPYVSMSESPTHPQGFCQHGETEHWCVDTQKPERGHYWPPAVGRKHWNSAFGRRIRFQDLPLACQSVVRNDYRDLWELWPDIMKPPPNCPTCNGEREWSRKGVATCHFCGRTGWVE